jgi:membrane AbrB-like protein
MMISKRAARDVAITLAAAVSGGALFAFLDMPAPWLTGSVLVVLTLALAKAPLLMPDPIRVAIFVAIGVQIGSGFGPDMVERVAKWPFSLVGLGVAVLLVIVTCSAFLVRVPKWSRETAFYASVPGALSLVLALSMRSTADVRLVMLAQILRLVSLLAIMPTLLTITLAPPSAPAQPALDYLELGLILLLAAPLAYVLERRGMPAGSMLAGITVSAALHFFGVVHGQLPTAVLIPCQIVLGANIGARFTNTDLAFLKRAIMPSLATFFIAVAVSTVAALFVAWAFELPAGQVVVAFAPGGIEAMTLMAIVLGFDPAFVATHQLARFFGLALMLPLISKLFLRNLPAPDVPSNEPDEPPPPHGQSGR